MSSPWYLGGWSRTREKYWIHFGYQHFEQTVHKWTIKSKFTPSFLKTLPLGGNSPNLKRILIPSFNGFSHAAVLGLLYFSLVYYIFFCRWRLLHSPFQYHLSLLWSTSFLNDDTSLGCHRNQLLIKGSLRVSLFPPNWAPLPLFKISLNTNTCQGLFTLISHAGRIHLLIWSPGEI